VDINDIARINLPWQSYYYLGSPYSKYPGGIEAAFQEICRITGEFAKRNISAYSPIAHTHPVAKASGLDPLDHKIWLPFDTPMMRGAYGLIVVCMESWKESHGLAHEIEWFGSHGRPIFYMVPPC
jgi:hypothetical protein